MARGATHYTQLIVWQLADAIRITLAPLLKHQAFLQDHKGRNQLSDACESVCRNIAEGFSAGPNREFAKFLTYSRRSLNEVLDALRGAELKGYVSTADTAPIRTLSRRLFPALSGLIAHLRKHPDGGRRL